VPLQQHAVRGQHQAHAAGMEALGDRPEVRGEERLAPREQRALDPQGHRLVGNGQALLQGQATAGTAPPDVAVRAALVATVRDGEDEQAQRRHLRRPSRTT
jgi:hypothetical protein